MNFYDNFFWKSFFYQETCGWNGFSENGALPIEGEMIKDSNINHMTDYNLDCCRSKNRALGIIDTVINLISFA